MRTFLIMFVATMMSATSRLVAQSAGPEKLYACYRPGSGLVYRIKVQSLPESCTSGDVEFSWAAKGASGPEGERGARGLDGAAGPSGPQGSAGDAGGAGPTGPQGPDGEAGPQGVRGPQGPAGLKGPTGPVGQPGPTGEPGTRGPPGVSGETGAKGPRGDPGPALAGVAGPPGPQGAAGSKGVTGYSSISRRTQLQKLVVAPQAQAGAEARCNSDETAVGGGFKNTDLNSDTGSWLRVVSSRPLGTQEQGWRVVAFNLSLSDGAKSLDVFAICVSVQ